ncbi:Membrane-bound lytic murein transglycosylase D [hydrothermal vent metagenome]|uniref:Membrane-bound lytic murein transglycosylase D n=1 Tax=hydrothermal vent metagenome TaxID=652676 RepID=A0A3B0TNN1_9ZZZZ
MRIAIPGVIIIQLIIIFSLLNSAFKPIGPECAGKFRFTPVELPDSLSFAGEDVPLEYFDILESFDRELLSNSYFHSQTIRLIKLAPRYFSIIEPILKEKGIPDDFKYLAVAESNLDPRAVSPAMAVGLWQFLKETAREYGLEVNSEVDERYHIEKSTYAACDFFLDSYKKFGSWALVAASYNGGRSFILQQIERQKTNNYFDLLLGEETGRYIFRILALKTIMENPEKYNFSIKNREKYPLIPTKNIKVTGAVENFADFAKTHGTNYKILKKFNPWLREAFLTNKTGKEYVIKVPVKNSRKRFN